MGFVAPNTIIAGYVLLGIASISVQSSASAATPGPALTDPKREWTASIRWENDIFAGTDRYYTDGISLGLLHTGPSWMDPVADWLPWGEGRRTVGYALTQTMYTPANKDLSEPDPNDRPYAGILAVALALHVEHARSYHGLAFFTGVVGPASLAEDTQRLMHHWLGNNVPQGWNHQLHNEPILNLVYEYRHKFQVTGDRERWSLEALPLAGGWLGNVLIQGEIGGLVRFGYHMPDDFGPTLVRGMEHMPPPRHSAQDRSRSDWGFSVYGGGFINLVARDITLDGNTFRDSPSVTRRFFVPAAGFGLSVGNRHFQASSTYVFWGREFKGEPKASGFGSLTVSYFF